ncbi:MAG: PhzF family phenazine biosynthesis protein [Halobacteriales archaeon]|nr:PhzF family phenazine biosynthesis protein [Halobacteriales archaeon]
MDRRRALLVDAFTEEPLAGNAAGVVPDADGLNDPQLRAIARELGASETAFVTESAEADRRLRYFTPTAEVDLCGHATVAAHAHLHEAGELEPGSHTFETNVGVLDAEIEPDGTVWMTQRPPEVREVGVEIEAAAEALGLDPQSVFDVELPLARATTGVPVLVVPVDFLGALGDADPDRAAVLELCEAADADGVYAFTFDTLDADATLHGRFFGPAIGIEEDPVTGTASGAIAGYLRHVGAFSPMPDELVCEQGHFVDRPGRVRVRLDEVVEVGGRATTALDGELTVADLAADDIIEA